MQPVMKYSALAAAVWAFNATALPVMESDSTSLNLSLDGGLGYFNSQQSYGGNSGFRSEEGSVSWQEGYFKAGLDGSHSFGSSSVYGGVSVSATSTTGDGDAAGLTNGEERRVALENAYLGWKSGSLIPALGENGVDISFGRQTLAIGDGFLINGDALNAGKGAEEALESWGVPAHDVDRGGAYWMGGSARSAFDRTLIVRLGGDSGMRADVFKVQSDNRLQGWTDFSGINLEYVGETGTVGALLFTTDSYGSYSILADRDNLDTMSLRYQGSLGIDNLFFSSEVARQKSDSGVVAHAGYVEAGWTFADLMWSPQLTYRYSSFDENFDALYYGFSRGYGTWFQGEVAANYAGPFNSNTDVQHIGLKASVNDGFSIGALWFDFSDHQKQAGVNNNGQELDLYAEYFLNDNMLVSPLLGFYSPEKDAANGGSQLGNSDTNLYAQLGFYFFY
ncbi:alginate export family protein [Oceanobacter mangrovi]|uniref:alginate export family protein n=1 Tax=Oceanobacter mangrovi TaxID=2862510 RepID=UPI001C8E1733|nr:alginate export family protein [Oceanobacter mangrovi]